jgi:cytochrome c-type biogenesis protein CcmH
MAHGGYNNVAGFLIEDDAIISHAEPCTVLSFQLFDVALTRLRKSIEPGGEALAQLRWQLHPLPPRGWFEDDRTHQAKYRILRYLCQGLLAIWIALAAPAFAVQPDEIMPDPAKEARARDLSRELRCMVCQNQSIDDSEAPLARDLRLLVRERIAAGDSDAQVIDFLVARYGEFVLLKPRFESHTLLLWLLPPFALLGGALALWAHNRRRSKPGREAESSVKLSADEEARLQRLIAPERSPEQSA